MAKDQRKGDSQLMIGIVKYICCVALGLMLGSSPGKFGFGFWVDGDVGVVADDVCGCAMI